MDENEVQIDLGQVQPIKGIDYYTEEEGNEFEETVENTISTNLDTTYQTTENKVNELNESSTNSQYPNAQLVYNELNKRDIQLDYVDTCNKGFRDEIPTGTEEGEFLNLTDCGSLSLKDFKLKGKENAVVTGDNTVEVVGKNFCNINNFTNQENAYRKIVVGNGTITITNNTSSNGYADSNMLLKDICPELKAGMTVYFNIETNGLRKIAILTSPSTTWTFGTALTITEEMLEKKVILYGGYNTTTVISNMQISFENDTNFVPYQAPQTQLLSLGNIQVQPNQTIQKYNNQWCIDTTPIEDTTLIGQLDNLMKIPMNKGIKNISTTTENDTPILEIVYYKDLGALTKDLETRLELLET